MKGLRYLVRSMRPQQWVKNVFVFAGIFFSGNLSSLPLLAHVAYGCALFCVLSAGVYLINDIVDRQADRVHPFKAQRPIASGAVPAARAGGAAALLLTTGLAGAFVLDVDFGLVALAYVAVQLAYSLGIKRLVILDVFFLSFGFLLRIAAGTTLAHVYISPWIVLCSFLLTLMIGLGKRRHEAWLLGDAAAAHRSSLSRYSLPLLDQLIASVAAATVLAYSLYTISSSTARRIGSDALLGTVLFVVYGIFRYLYLLHRKKGDGAPEELLIKDVPFVVNFVLWIAVTFMILYRA